MPDCVDVSDEVCVEDGVLDGVCGALGEIDAVTVCVRVCVIVPVDVCVKEGVLGAVCVLEPVCETLCVELIVIVFEMERVVVSLTV